MSLYYKKLAEVLKMIHKIDTEFSKEERARVVYIDGGECIGTTTITNSLTNLLHEKGYSKFIKTREPSQECKDSLITELTYNGRLLSPGEQIHKIIDIFMADRRENQLSCGENIKISDRGLFSTYVYQSGILDDDSSVKDVKKNCEAIYNSFIDNEIKLPLISINIVTLDNDSKSDVEVFDQRLNKRKNSNIKLDGMDKVPIMMSVNRVYSDITKRFINDDSLGLICHGSYIGIEHKQSIVDIVDTIYRIIKQRLTDKIYITDDM
ncbi:MAG: hypothetical protein ACOCZ5_01455 [bacterium]